VSVELSVVIPVHNEEKILERATHDLVNGLDGLEVSYEILLAENGSADATAEVARALAARLEGIRTFSVPEPNYGRALKEGIARATGEFVSCEEIDLCDVDFAWRALEILRTGDVDMVIGSKLMRGSADNRPMIRHAASHIYSGLLRVALGFPGTDTHGLKAFRADRAKPIAERCVVDRDVFASELVIRAHRDGLVVREIPVQLDEKRPPSVRLLRRVPRVLGNLIRLTRAIGVR
jgi:glycosyltransferase involved in cell wall biosynthesis